MMDKPLAKFVAITAGLVTVYLAIVALALDQNATSPTDHAVVQGTWVAFGAHAIVTCCAAFEALSEQLWTGGRR